MSLIHGDHFTAFIYQFGSATIEYGDSTHNHPPSYLLLILKWIFEDVAQPPIKEIRAGIIAWQGVGNSEGSCGIAAYNFIELAAQTWKGLKLWIGSFSHTFHDATLEDLLQMHHLAHEVGGTFSNWTVCSLPQMSRIENAMATGYNDFNMYAPLVHHFQLSL
ncbi:hypothetical protein CPB84DRAFT_1816349 [Gymnopilus junonius]|uniref:Uncharacterized protein n=1 Tax=Gymnopilus junonius TaxID=109634 RepID=A0A9P5TLQ9_GYMJU|nr:hypothetical protein CPB84DRAFT_1816349 [Gymnopilus junonius]